MKQNKEILFSESDKGNSIVIISKVDYIRKVEAILLDDKYYTVCNRNPMVSIKNSVKKIVMVWNNWGVFEDFKLIRSLNSEVDSSDIARAY